MDIDFEKLFKYLAIENSLLVLGVLSFLLSLYNGFILGMKLGFLFLIFGAIFRIYTISIVRGLLHNYMNKPQYRIEIKDSNGNVVEGHRVPFEESWYIHAIDFILCLIILISFVYSFVYLINF